MSNQWEREFDLRQCRTMLSLFDDYTGMKISLQHLIPKIEVLFHSLKQSTSEWDTLFFEEFGNTLI